MGESVVFISCPYSSSLHIGIFPHRTTPHLITNLIKCLWGKWKIFKVIYYSSNSELQFAITLSFNPRLLGSIIDTPAVLSITLPKTCRITSPHQHSITLAI